MPIDCLSWHAAEHSVVLTQVSMNSTSLFCLPATILVLMSKNLSLNYTYSNNRCEPFKDGSSQHPQKKVMLMSLGQTAQRQLITRGLGPFIRSWVKGSEKEFQLTPIISLLRLTWTHKSSQWLLKITGKWAVGWVYKFLALTGWASLVA